MKAQNPKKIKIKKPLAYHVGNSLMIIATILLFYTYEPLVRVYFFPQHLANLSHAKGTFIQIPKISAQAPLISNVDPWNENEYLQKLHEGVALAKGFALPGTGGVLYIFAHSSDLPWNITRYNTAFFRLNELKKNDTVNIFMNGVKYQYKIYDEKIVWPNNIDAIKIRGKNLLILQTCTPVGTDWQRLLLYAKLAQ